MNKTVTICCYILTHCFCHGQCQSDQVRPMSITEYLGIGQEGEDLILVPVEEDNIRIYLFTRLKPYGFRLQRGNIRNIRNSGYNPAFPTKVLIHGYLNNITSDSIQLLKDGLQRGDIHVLGHSLGSHVASFTAEALRFKPARITGLDPAAPFFSEIGPNNRLDTEDAEFVDIIHTSVRFLGMTNTIGHLDFYPSGGRHQPRCHPDIVEEVIGACDHGEAYAYFAESIVQPDKYVGARCSNQQAALGTKCYGGAKGIMGEEAIYHTAPGVYYVDVEFLRASNFIYEQD